MISLIRCIFGPRLHHVFRIGDQEGHAYIPNSLEIISDGIIKTISWAWSFGFYTSPVAAFIFYRRDSYNIENFIYVMKLMATVGAVLAASTLIRGIGRYANSEYKNFIAMLEATQRSSDKAIEELINKYDFDFSAWPVSFSIDQIEGETEKPKIHLSSSLSSKRNSIFDRFIALPCQILSYIIIHSFGRRMIYPGSIGLLQAAMDPVMREGRVKLIEELGGHRIKLLARDGNHIDSLYIDRRGKTENGSFLFIGCEGNAAYYEIGVLGSVLEAGYSAFGWNHPGFGGSTGAPFPDQEANAIDVVIQYAIHKLNFPIDHIVLFGWSIGGFSASWAAMNYPEIRGVILDATFDDIVPLAVNKMPTSWKPLVIRTIKEYMNLNNAQQLNKYSGPVLLIRRTRDELITTEYPTMLAGNRGNNLLIKILQHRYPNILTADSLPLLMEWLSSDPNRQAELLSLHEVEDDLCKSLFTSYIHQNSNAFPILIGDDLSTEQKNSLLLYLTCQHMMDIETTHCTPLPSELIRLPWKIDHDNSSEA